MKEKRACERGYITHTPDLVFPPNVSTLWWSFCVVFPRKVFTLLKLFIGYMRISRVHSHFPTTCEKFVDVFLFPRMVWGYKVMVGWVSLGKVRLGFMVLVGIVVILIVTAWMCVCIKDK